MERGSHLDQIQKANTAAPTGAKMASIAREPNMGARPKRVDRRQDRGEDDEDRQGGGPEAVIKKQIAQLQADKQISAKYRKDMIDQLNAPLPTIHKLQHPGNADIIVKNYDKLNETMPQE